MREMLHELGSRPELVMETLGRAVAGSGWPAFRER
jgi:hypothetical protein